ncbi:uncharacterized protein VTP21DRAFT_3162 [Calcarisporiella thermophila]|uniref:uncharacterized protein n=1 Tax=Calcarisporiella thermophila TaxID=911321 RepID=UPI003743A930
MSKLNYNFVKNSESIWSGDVSNFSLIFRQQPKQARVCNSKERADRRPIDPPPIVQIKLDDAGAEESQRFLQSPNFFMCADIVSAKEYAKDPVLVSQRPLVGSNVSSLHRLKDIDNTDGGFFVFGDLSVRVEGNFRLKLNLYRIKDEVAMLIQTIYSEPFTVYSAKEFPGMAESTFLSRSFSDQGVKLRIRKEHRIQLKRAAPLLSPPSGHDQDASGKMKVKRQRSNDDVMSEDRDSTPPMPTPIPTLPLNAGEPGLISPRGGIVEGHTRLGYPSPISPEYSRHSFSSPHGLPTAGPRAMSLDAGVRSLPLTSSLSTSAPYPSPLWASGAAGGAAGRDLYGQPSQPSSYPPSYSEQGPALSAAGAPMRSPPTSAFTQLHSYSQHQQQYSYAGQPTHHERPSSAEPLPKALSPIASDALYRSSSAGSLCHYPPPSTTNLHHRDTPPHPRTLPPPSLLLHPGFQEHKSLYPSRWGDLGKPAAPTSPSAAAVRLPPPSMMLMQQQHEEANKREGGGMPFHLASPMITSPPSTTHPTTTQSSSAFLSISNLQHPMDEH